MEEKGGERNDRNGERFREREIYSHSDVNRRLQVEVSFASSRVTQRYSALLVTGSEANLSRY